MEKNNKPTPPPDEWTAKLQASLKKDRPQTRRLVLVFVVLAAAGLGIVVWLLFPRPKPPPLLVVACDALVSVGADASCEAWVDAQGEDPLQVRRGDQVLHFQKPPLPWEKPQTQSAKTDSRGRALGPAWIMDKPGPVKCLVALAVNAEVQGPARDDCLLFAWPPTSRLLLVAVDTLVDRVTLADKHIQDIPLPPETAQALQAAAADHWQIVYLAWHAAGPLPYKKARSWVHLCQQKKELPPGPMLGCWGTEGKTGDWDEKLKELHKRFQPQAQGGHRAVVQNLDQALVGQKAGFTPLLMGKADEAPGVETAASWKEAGNRLQKK